VNGVRGAGRYVDQVDAQGNPVTVTYSDGTVAQARVYESDVKTMIALLQPVMEQYIVTSRRFAVRMVLQGGLKDFARGLSYDAARDVYTPTGERQLAPMFEGVRAWTSGGRPCGVAFEANDNDVWPERTFCFDGWEVAA
jgi:hypothetical protein